MKINATRTTPSSSNNSYEDFLLEIEADSGYIILDKKPKKIIWYKDNREAIIWSSKELEEQEGPEYVAPPGFTKAMYVPDYDFNIRRAVDILGLDVPLNSSATIDDWAQLLNLKLEKAERQLSIWDTYNIYKVIYNSDELASAISSLPLSSSVLININEASYRFGNWTIKKGDMIVKDYLGELHWVKGSNGGFYFPSKIVEVSSNSTSESEAINPSEPEAINLLEEGSNSTNSTSAFKITFQFSTENPQEGSKTINSDSEEKITIPYKTMNLQFPQMEGVESLCYASQGTLDKKGTLDENKKDTSITLIDVIKNTSEKVIQPIVYLYIDGKERIFLDSDYETDDAETKITLSNPTQMKLTYEVR